MTPCLHCHGLDNKKFLMYVLREGTRSDTVQPVIEFVRTYTPANRPLVGQPAVKIMGRKTDVHRYLLFPTLDSISSMLATPTTVLLTTNTSVTRPMHILP
jgi:hypothetical protein